MRVAVITRYFPTSQEPWAGHSAYQTLRFLAQRCDLKVFYPESQYPRMLVPRSRAGRSLNFEHQVPDVAVQYIPYPALPAVSRPLNGWSAARSVLPHVRQFQPDVILNYIIYPDGYAALRVARALKVPFVVTAIGSDLNKISDPLCGILTRKVLREADGVITVSSDLLKTALRLEARPERSRAILNGCDTTIFRHRDKREARQALGIDEASEAIVYVGRLDLAKGLRELIEATASLRIERPQAHCYIIGDGPDRPALVEAIAQQNVAQWVTLVPACPSDKVAVWMAAADLITLPSYREGCPNVVIEALASGRPVVATNVGGIPELMDDHSGRLVPARDAAALATALADVLAQKWDPAELSGRHSRNWSDVANDVQQALEKVLPTRFISGR
jgi:teichuronic acid biosynthesis glycosyltransferase TuaC